MHSDISIEEDVNDLNQKVGLILRSEFLCLLCFPFCFLKMPISFGRKKGTEDECQSDKKDAFSVICAAYLEGGIGLIQVLYYSLQGIIFFSGKKNIRETPRTKTAFIFVSAGNHLFVSRRLTQIFLVSCCKNFALQFRETIETFFLQKSH